MSKFIKLTGCNFTCDGTGDVKFEGSLYAETDKILYVYHRSNHTEIHFIGGRAEMVLESASAIVEMLEVGNNPLNNKGYCGPL